MSQPLVNAEMLAQRLGCSSKHILRMAKAKKITSINLGPKVIRFDMATIEAELGLPPSNFPSGSVPANSPRSGTGSISSTRGGFR